MQMFLLWLTPGILILDIALNLYGIISVKKKYNDLIDEYNEAVELNEKLKNNQKKPRVPRVKKTVEQVEIISVPVKSPLEKLELLPKI